jgi:hypothetical protein
LIDIEGFVTKLRADLDRLLRIIIVHPDKVQIRSNIETPVEGYVGPSSTAGIYFKSNKYGFGTVSPAYIIDAQSSGGVIIRAAGGTDAAEGSVFYAEATIAMGDKCGILGTGTSHDAWVYSYSKDLHFSASSATPHVTVYTNGTVAVSEKCAMNATGGFMVKLTNKTGGNSVKGEVVTTDSTTNNAVKKIVVDVPNPIGVFFESGIADGAEAWIVVSGIADVYFVGNTTRGHIARGFETADGASYVTGQAMSEAVPTSPFSVDKHFYEMGHVLETRTGAGLSKVVLHFN